MATRRERITRSPDESRPASESHAANLAFVVPACVAGASKAFHGSPADIAATILPAD
jgi:hypothetical protein